MKNDFKHLIHTSIREMKRANGKWQKAYRAGGVGTFGLWRLNKK